MGKGGGGGQRSQGALASTTAEKTSLLTEFTVFQTLSRLFQFAENFKCRQISLELFLGTALKLRERKENSSTLVYVLDKS